jgi:hypothetical protein
MMAGMTKNHIRWKEAAEMWKENWLVTTLCLGTMAFFFFYFGHWPEPMEHKIFILSGRR